MKLVVSIPTRGRAQRLPETLKRNLACLSDPNTVVMVQVDEDDDETMLLTTRSRSPNLFWSTKPREDTIAEKWNRALTIPADVYMMIGDDDPLTEPDTDRKVLEAASLFPDGIGMVYGHLANASFTSTPCMTRRMAEILGWLQPEHFPYWFCDHWTDDIARIIGRIAFADIRTDQSRVGKTMELREPGWWATWFDAAKYIRRDQAHNIINHPEFKSPDWLKKMLLTHHPLIEFRSKWINDHVRAQSRDLEMWSGLKAQDERYKRVKDRAIVNLPALYGTMPEVEARFYRDQLQPPTTIANIK